jgi:hypothetical protein
MEGRELARARLVNPSIMAEMPIAVSGIEEIRKYATGANMTPAVASPNPKILYGLRVSFSPFEN